MIVRLFIGGIELVGYEWLYQYRIIDLNWQSQVTWWITALGADFAYYWLHRLSHGEKKRYKDGENLW